MPWMPSAAPSSFDPPRPPAAAPLHRPACQGPISSGHPGPHARAPRCSLSSPHGPRRSSHGSRLQPLKPQDPAALVVLTPTGSNAPAPPWLALGALTRRRSSSSTTARRILWEWSPVPRIRPSQPLSTFPPRRRLASRCFSPAMAAGLCFHTGSPSETSVFLF